MNSSKPARVQGKSLLQIKGVGQKYVEIIQQWQQTSYFAPEVAWVGEMIIEDAQRILEMMISIKRLEAQIVDIAKHSEMARRIQSIPGFGIISSAELAGEIGTLDRFTSESSLALYIGVAALDNQFGQFKGTKTLRQVNKRAKTAMLVAGAQHIKQVPSSKRYYDKKRAEGKKHNQAIRALGRHLTRVIWSLIKQTRDYEIR
jgi:transposase